MAIVFPTSLDNFPNPSPTDLVENVSPDLDHNTQHANANDAIEALEVRVGITGSADPTSLTKRIAVLEAAPASSGADGVWLPADNGLKSWTWDPICATQLLAIPNTGLLFLFKLRLPATTVTNVHIFVGNTTTPTTFYAALYAGTAGGALLSQSANTSASFGTATLKTLPLGTPQVVSAGIYYVGFWGTGSLPTLYAGPTAGIPNANLAATVSRYGTANSGLTTTAPATLGAIIANGNNFWVAVS